MKKWFILILSVLLALPALSQSTKQIVIGQIDSLASKILHEKRKIWVHVPDSYQQEVYPNDGIRSSICWMAIVTFRQWWA